MDRKTGTRLLAALPVVAVACWYGYSRAQSTSATTPLLYTGYLEDAGAPVSGSRSIGLNLWNATDTTDVANRVCQQGPTATDITNGWFNVQLGPECVDAVRHFPALRLEFVVESTAFPLQPIGAVPYALRAFDHEGGSRLRRIVRTASDGAKLADPDRWWDSLRGEECRFLTRSATGDPPSGLCLPPASIGSGSGLESCLTSARYTDSACTIPAGSTVGWGRGLEPPRYLPSTTSSSGRALVGPATTHYCVGLNPPGTCAALGTPFYPLGADIPASEFVSWQEGHD